MRKRIRLLLFVIILTASTGCALSVRGEDNKNLPQRPDAGVYMSGSETTADTSVAATAAESTLPTSTPTPTPPPTPTPTPATNDIVVSFAGDCTLGQNKGLEGNSNSFSSVVGTDYAYPFKNAVDILSKDNMTLVNFEGVLTESTTPREKEFTFRGPPEYANILKLGSVEAVNLANNHSYDYWDKGLTETKNTLDTAGIKWSLDSSYAIYETNGVKIGMAGFLFPGDLKPIYKAIDSLRSQGCEIVIISVHAGVERMYEPEASQVSIAHAIIDYGADIYVGHHPHRLQPIELYHGKYIMYSLSNFTFGGQPYLTDPDTAIVQCTFSVSWDTDKVVQYKLHVIPFSMTTTFPGNDYCPIPYAKGSDGYQSVMDKLKWSDSLDSGPGVFVED